MSLVLPTPRPLPIRGLLLLTAFVTSCLGIAPTLTQTTSTPPHKAHCACAHCPGGALCPCHGKRSCPAP